MKKALLIAGTLAALATTSAQADVTLALNGGFITNKAGANLPDGKTGALIADLGNDGFGDFTSLTSGFANEGDRVLYRFETFDTSLAFGGGVIDSVRQFFTATDNLSQIATGTPLLLAIWDLDFEAGATGPGVGVDFLTFRENNWTWPGDPTTLFTLEFFSVDAGGTIPNQALQTGANGQTTVPEPASLAMFGIGAFLLFSRNKRQA